MLVEWFRGQVNELGTEHVEFRCLAWTRATDVTSSVFAGNWSLRSRLDCPGRAGEWAKQWAECVSLEIYYVRHPLASAVFKWLIIFRQLVRLHYPSCCFLTCLPLLCSFILNSEATFDMCSSPSCHPSCFLYVSVDFTWVTTVFLPAIHFIDHFPLHFILLTLHFWHLSS